MMKRLMIGALVLFAALSAASAEQIVDETRPASARGTVSVELISGSLKVIGWGSDEVRVTGTLGDDVEELAIETRGDEISIEVELPRGQKGSIDADAELEIYVPTGSKVEADTVSADVTVEAMNGSAEIESVSGEVRIDADLKELEVGTVSGTIAVSSTAPLRNAELESVSGDIEVRAPLAPTGDFSFETVSGDVDLRLPASVSADFNVETFSGKIDNDLGPSPDRGDDGEPGKRLRFSTGSGEARVEIESFSGRIKIRAD